MPKIIQGRFKILSNRKAGPDYFKMKIQAPRITQKAKAGQFVHLRCQDGFEPLLRRPFSFHTLNKNNFDILYKIIGQGTKLLAKKRRGDTIDVLGPLGNGFELGRYSILDTRFSILDSRYSILIAGGMGVAPLVALAEKWLNKKRTIVLLGAKTKKGILCIRDFRKLGCKVHIATEDGSCGHKGLVTELLKKVLGASNIEHRASIYACGPKAMLKEIASISRRLHLPAQGSLEENMACGVGACLGCAIKTKDGYKRVCKDGPVFDLKDIIWGK